MANNVQLTYATAMEEVVITKLTDNPAQHTAEAMFKYMQSVKFFEVPSFLLLSGGSCIDVAKALIELLPKNATLSQLTIGLADERLVPKGDANSNEQQLRDAGVITAFENLKATFIPLLSDDAQTAETQANSTYEEKIKASEKIILLAGMGADGHTAGILPHASAEAFKLFSTDKYVASYQIPAESDNPFKSRITITMATLAFIDTVFLYVLGEEKLPALQSLIAKNKNLHELPALSLYLSQQPLQLFTNLSV